MIIITIEQVKRLLEENTKQQPKAKYSNNVLFNMCNGLDNNDCVECELASGKGLMLNRGSLCECLVKMHLGFKGVKSAQKTSDLDTTKISAKVRKYLGLPNTNDLEIKFATSFAYGSAVENVKTRNILVCNQKGVYLVGRKGLNMNASKHIKSEQPHGEYLQALSELLGY